MKNIKIGLIVVTASIFSMTMNFAIVVYTIFANIQIMALDLTQLGKHLP